MRVWLLAVGNQTAIAAAGAIPLLLGCVTIHGCFAGGSGGTLTGIKERPDRHHFCWRRLGL
jgi:hypothetical protein